MDAAEQRVARLLEVAGTTDAEQTGIRPAVKPMPRFGLLMLCMLAGKPIDAGVAQELLGKARRYGESSDHDPVR